MAEEVKLSNGKRRVRLDRGVPTRRSNAADHLHEARRESMKKAPRLENGKVVPGYHYKEILNAHKEFGIEPKTQANVNAKPLFVTQPGIANQLVKLIRAGYPYTTVCRYVGVSRDTFIRWLTLGRDGHPVYKKLYERIANAEARAEIRTLKKLREHEDVDWRVSAWQLERRWPEHWGKRDAVRAELKVHGDVNVSHKHELGNKVIADETARQLARKMIEGEEFGFERVEDAEEVTPDA